MLNRHFENLKKKKEHTWEGFYLEEMTWKNFFERYKFYKLFVVVTSMYTKIIDDIRII